MRKYKKIIHKYIVLRSDVMQMLKHATVMWQVMDSTPTQGKEIDKF